MDDESIEDELDDGSSEYNEVDASFSEPDEEEVDFEDLKTYHNQKFEEGEEKEFLNQSTANFNKAIK